jgi:hypothetical protein
MKNIFNIKTVLLFAIVFAAASCTKVKTDDDFTKGDPPPVPGGFTNSNQVAAANLIGYWSFEGNLKDAVSSIVGTNNGMTFSAGLKGQALEGSQNNSDMAYAFTNPSPAISALTQYTVSCWVNTNENIGATGVFSLGNKQEFWGNINIFLENGNTSTKARFKTIFQNGSFQADNNIQEVDNGFNKWVNYVITYNNAGVFTSYVNGTSAATKTVPTTNVSFNNVGPIVFGTLHFMTTPSSTTATTAQPWAGYLRGKIDEVRIYNKALTETEVSALSILERQGR